MKQLIRSVLLALCLLLLASCGAAPAPVSRESVPAAEPSEAPDPDSSEAPAAEPSEDPAEETLTCTVVACGDIVPHSELLQEAYSEETGRYDFTPMLRGVEPLLEDADYAFCTTECAYVESGFSAYPCFRTPAALLEGLRDVGFDMICLASNHCCDAKIEGVFSSIDACEAIGLDHTGTYRTSAERESDRGILFRELNGIRVAFIDYTSITNQYNLYDRAWAVRTLFRDYTSVNPKKLLYDEIDADIAFARSAGADIVIVICHWGNEYMTEPAAYQTELAERMLGDGADIIIGSHPHVPQSAAVCTVRDEAGTLRTGYVFQSLGNFFTGMTNELGNISPCVRMELEKDPFTGRASVRSVEYSLLCCVSLPSHPDDGGPRCRLLNPDTPLPDWLPASLVGSVRSARSRALAVLGEELYANR